MGGAVTGYLSLNEGSGVDLNNDGRIDLVQHTYNLNNYYTLSSLINQGMGRLSGAEHHQYLPERGGQWRYEQQRFHDLGRFRW